MTRRRHALLTWSSLALAVLFLGLLAYSFRYVDLVQIVTAGRQQYSVGTRQGSLFVVRQPEGFPSRTHPRRWTHVRMPSNTLPGRNFLGFRSYNDGTFAWLAIPLWLPAIPLLLLAWRIWKTRPLAPGLCRKCGYDLRASPERCPECGTVPASS